MPLNAIWLFFSKKDLIRASALCYNYNVKRKEIMKEGVLWV